MQRFFSILADGVRRFEGTVDKFTGDGIMAVFGAPIAHEDHARRACYAALRMLDDVAEYAAELRREHGLNFSVRIGINSGEVVAGAIGEGGDGDYTAIGHTVGLAQRMEALAEPGKAYLTEHAAELAARLPRAGGPRRVRDQGGEPAGPGLRAGRGRRGALAARPLARARLLPLRRPRRGDGGARGGARAGRGAARAPWSASSPSPASARAASATSSPSAAAARGIEVFEAQAPGARRRRSPSCRCCRCCAPTSGSTTATRSGSRARRSPAGRCCSTPTSPTTCRCSSTSSACPTPSGRLPQMSAEARQRALRRRRLPARPGARTAASRSSP